MAQQLESSQSFQRDGEKYFFACEIDFIETADREKNLARGEEKGAGRPILPVAVVTSRRIELDNWERSAINLPFGRGALVGGRLEGAAID